MREPIALEKARSRLAMVWFGGSGLVFLVLVIQSLGGVFVGDLDKAWAWALPNMAPTLSLMVSVFASYALMPAAEEDKYVVRRTFLNISLALSIFYIINVLIVIGSAPFAKSNISSLTTTNPTDVLHVSNFWLGPLQGLTAASLAALFFTKTEQSP
jgi:4-amino-4-deoxy-L-arabinose transferase-like glycosyltransferase